jgi:hypothetical protein
MHGHFLTNYHVIANAWKVQVTKADGSTAGAKLVDLDAGNDVAELEVEGPSTGLAFSPDLPASHQHIYVIGNPLGTNPNTVTEGHITALGQSATTTDNRSYGGVIFTDADAEHGSSGSPVIDERGKVLGILAGGAPNRADTFFIPNAQFRAQTLTWLSQPTRVFEAPPPDIGFIRTPDNHNYQWSCDAPGQCSFSGVIQNFGGPGRVTITFCVTGVSVATCSPGAALASCGSSVTLDPGQKAQVQCTASGIALYRFSGATVWGSYSKEQLAVAP